MRGERRRWPGLPISAQILTLLMGSLVAAQAVTLALTLMLPPAPPQQHSLAEVAAALKGEAPAGGAHPLIRSVQAQPPSLQSPGWLVSQQSTQALAVLLHAPETDVRLLFYAPPPLAGGLAPPPPPGLPRPDLLRRSAVFGFMLAPGPGGGGFPGGGFPGGGFPGGRGPGGPMGGPIGGPGVPMGGPMPGPVGGQGQGQGQAPAGPPSAGSQPMGPGFPSPGGGDARPSRGPSADAPATGSGHMGDAPSGGAGDRASGGGAARGGARPPMPVILPPVLLARPPLDAAVFDGPAPVASPSPTPPAARLPTAPTSRATPVVHVAAPAPGPSVQVAPPTPIMIPTPSARVADVAPAAPEAAPLAPPRSSALFGLAPASYVEGEFIAAVRVAPGEWVTVRPRPEGFPNSWQRRVLLWFALSFAVVAPVGYLFARRLAAPLQHFAVAAETLGRDPTAEVSAKEGPAEVGRAARAFNLMQRRLKRYVEDRTAMIGAISHDLRTPLARMRFRLERASPELRAAISRDIVQMEEMISAVLVFMRDEAAAGRRERADLRSILEVVVDDAHAEGADVELAPGAPVEVDVDLVAVQRVFENLVSNAVKYGDSAKARLNVQAGEAVVEVIDAGPGLPEAELENVFRPFYRTPDARASNQHGMGLGLTVSRSTIRAHGGELSLANGPDGLVAQVRLPLAALTTAAA